LDVHQQHQKLLNMQSLGNATNKDWGVAHLILVIQRTDFSLSSKLLS